MHMISTIDGAPAQISGIPNNMVIGKHIQTSKADIDVQNQMQADQNLQKVAETETATETSRAGKKVT